MSTETKSETTGTCGCSTAEKPFAYASAVKGVFVVSFKGELFSSLGGGGIDDEEVQRIVKWLNEAYRLGFEVCGAQLMPQLMKGPVSQEYPEPEIRCAYPEGCGMRANGSCTLYKPCSKYVPRGKDEKSA